MKRAILVYLLIATTALLFGKITVLEQSPSYLLIEYRLDEWSLSEQDGFIRIDASGMDYAIQPGAPLLPLWESKVGIPPDGSAKVSVLSSAERRQELEKRLLPVPEVFAGEDISQHRYSIDESLYQGSAGELASFLDASSYRGYSYAPLIIRPFAYDGNRELKITEQAIIRIDIAGNTNLRSQSGTDKVSTVFLDHLLNSEQSVNWQSASRNPVYYSDFSKSDHWLRLETYQEGMYKITPAQMTGFPIDDIDPRSIRLFSNGGKLLPFTIINAGNAWQEIPIKVTGEADGSLDSGDYVIFYGTNRDGTTRNQSLQSNDTYFNPYSGNTVYWLTFGGEYDTPPQRMVTQASETEWIAETSVSDALARVETESQRREVEGFDWYMSRLFGSNTAEYQYEVLLSDVDTAKPQILSFMIRQEDVGVSIWHNISVYVNGTAIESNTDGSIIFRWMGTGEYVFYKEVESFVNGTNQIRIRIIRSGTDNLFLDWFTVDYSRLNHKGSEQLTVSQMPLNYGVLVRYNVTGTTTASVYQVNAFHQVEIVPMQSGSGSYFVASGTTDSKYILSTDSELLTPLNIQAATPRDLVSTAPQVDNVIIAPDEYLNQAEALADMYLNDLGINSLVVSQQDVFNQFNGGHPDPAAIRQFLRYAYHYFPEPRITSVTLMGLGSIDWRNFSGQAAAKNKIMVYQRNSTASDDYFVMLTQSNYPELAIGRYPVNNNTELGNMLSNFQHYVQDPQGGMWRDRMVFLGDDLFNGGQDSYENIHTRQTEEAADSVHPSVLIDRIFAWEYAYDEFQNKPDARNDMIEYINDGRLVWYYIGHGSYDKLGAEDYFNGASDMGRFNNSGHLPLFMAASCSVTHFDYWGYESLGQKVVLLNGLGAIASYSATRMSAPYSNAPMMINVLDYLANERNPLGYSIMSAKIRYTQSNENDATYILMGDPLLNIVPPERIAGMSVESNSPSRDAVLNSREIATLTGDFATPGLDGIAETFAYNSEEQFDLDWQTHVSHRGTPLFEGKSTVEDGQFSASFTVPDDVSSGDTGIIVSYIWDEAQNKDFVNYYHPLELNDQAATVSNPDSPSIEIYVGSMDFRNGDTVGSNPSLYVRISDSNGINLTGSSGHNILLILDDSLQPIPATQYFSYDLDSHTSGMLSYDFADLTEGPHTLKVVAFDNFNLPSVSTTSFVVKKSGALSIERFLIYPNPMSDATSFTFMLSSNSDLTISIHTMSGKKIHIIKTMGVQGFNSINWNGKDDRGDTLANNTYFVKIKAVSEGNTTEKIEKLVIYK